MKHLTFICCSLFLLSCSSNDDSICDCLSAGKNLQSFSSTLLQREATQKDAIHLKKLKNIQFKNDFFFLLQVTMYSSQR